MVSQQDLSYSVKGLFFPPNNWESEFCLHFCKEKDKHRVTGKENLLHGENIYKSVFHRATLITINPFSSLLNTNNFNFKISNFAFISLTTARYMTIMTHNTAKNGFHSPPNHWLPCNWSKPAKPNFKVRVNY